MAVFIRRSITFGVLGLLCSLLFTWWFKGEAAAKLHREGLGLGRSLIEVVGLDGNNARHVMHINGARLSIETKSVEGDENEIMRKAFGSLRSHCAITSETPQPLQRDLEDVMKEGGFDASEPLMSAFTFEHEGKKEGYIYCLKTHMPLSARGLGHMLFRFEESYDLNSLGTWIGLYAKKATGSVSFLAMRSEGPLRLPHLFPEKGDAKGRDFQYLPRPAGRRLLTVGLDGRTALNQYETRGSASEALFAFQSQLRKTNPHMTWTQPEDSKSFLLQDSRASYLVVAHQLHTKGVITIARLPD